MYTFQEEGDRYAIIGFSSVDGSQDGFYLHELNEDIEKYKKDSEWEWEIVGYTNETDEEFIGL
jgi:hypothetical protein